MNSAAVSYSRGGTSSGSSLHNSRMLRRKQYQKHQRAITILPYPINSVPFLNAEGFFEAFGDGGFSAGGSFDAVFMDIYMDGMDGVAAAHKKSGAWTTGASSCS